MMLTKRLPDALGSMFSQRSAVLAVQSCLPVGVSRRLAALMCVIGVTTVALGSPAAFAQSVSSQLQTSSGAVASSNTPNASISSPVRLASILDQIQQAARTLNYSGIFTYQQGPVIESSRIAHMLHDGVEREKLEVLDGMQREYLRVNDEVQCLIPEHQTVLLEKQRRDRFPGLLLSDASSISPHYEVSVEPKLARVAGRSCQIVNIMPRDEHRYGYRLCADHENALLLKAQMLDQQGQVIEQVAFTQVNIGEPLTPDRFVPSWSTQGWSVQKPDKKPVDLAKLGWRIDAPPGYMTAMQVERSFGRGKQAHQVVLSDGLATISIFIEPYLTERSDAYQPQGAARHGAVNLHGARVGNFWLTVMGEVPAETLSRLTQSIQYVPSQGVR